jgi:hypothetical protein
MRNAECFVMPDLGARQVPTKFKNSVVDTSGKGELTTNADDENANEIQ